LHVEQISLEKLRRDAIESRPCTRETHPAALKVNNAPVTRLSTVKSSVPLDKMNISSKKDVRWRTLVRISYQKAKFCARLLCAGQKEGGGRRGTGAIPPAGLRSSGVDVSPLKCASVVELNVTVAENNTNVRRGRSRSDAFIIPSKLWRPNASLFLSNSAPAATPSAVSCAAEWKPAVQVSAA